MASGWFLLDLHGVLIYHWLSKIVEGRRLVHVGELFNLSGKIAIVTGGSRGIGKEIAIGLGEAGAKVTITARQRYIHHLHKPLGLILSLPLFYTIQNTRGQDSKISYRMIPLLSDLLNSIYKAQVIKFKFLAFCIFLSPIW